MAKIFISYRRSDSRTISGRIYDQLATAFGGSESVFKDVMSIPFGVDFRTYIDESISQCDALLVIIGSAWVTAADDQGRRRLDDPNDFVRLEIESALKQGKPVYPVLVHGASMPRADALPEGLQPLAYRNAAVVRDDPDFHHDMDRLIDDMQAALGPSPAREPEMASEPAPVIVRAGPSRMVVWGAGALFVVAVIVITLLASGIIGGGNGDNNPDATTPLDASGALRGDVITAVPVRTRPAFEGGQIGFLPKGNTIILTGLSTNTRYFRIDYQDQIGWVYAPFVEPQSDPAALPLVEEIVGIAGAGVVVRAWPAFEAQEIAAVPVGDTVPLSGITPDRKYFRVDYQGQTGWVYASFIEPQTDYSALPVVGNVIGVAGVGVILRAQPAYEAEEVAIVPVNDTLTLVAITPDHKYFRVIYQGRTGWVYASFIKPQADVSSLPEISTQ